MSSKLPLNLEDLLRQRTVEGDRIEYKAGWNPDATIKTLCAFANDFENLGGGYIIIGQDCDEHGQPVFPPVGLAQQDLDRIQRELLAHCNAIQPSYFPHLSVERFEERFLIVLWAPGGQNRPYKAPRAVTARQKEYHYYIRRFSSTVEVGQNSEDEQELLRLTATVPFDDRQCQRAALEDLRLPLIQAYLKEVGSDLHSDAGKMPLADLCRQMNIVDGADEHVKPRNVGVLFFNDEPTNFLPGSQIDVVIFPKGPGGGELDEKVFRGPLHEQVRAALRFLQNHVLREKVVKHRNRAEATRIVNYPFAALEEALVNAVYHRSYELREPVEVRVNPDGIEILSYPGPDASIRPDALNGEKIVARRYRNRRIGEFLKELDLTEGRCTGIPTIRQAMAENGSPPPKFSTDDGRTYFLAELPVHPEMTGFDLGHVEGQERGHDEGQDGGQHPQLSETEAKILVFLARKPKSRAEIAEMLGMSSSRSGYLSRAIQQLRDAGLAELTIPEKPQSRNQRLGLTDKGEHTLPEPLRKKRADGSLYQRPSEIEASLAALELLPIKEIVERSKILDPHSAEYLPSECLLHFLRNTRKSTEIDDFRELFLSLRQRILAATPALERRSAGTSKLAVRAVDVSIQEGVLDAFNEMLCKDRNDYDDRLDYFEIRFNSALARLRLTARRTVMRTDSRTESMSPEEDTNAPSPEVEAALTKLKGFGEEEMPDFLYRSRLLAAINTLPNDEKRVIELILQDFLIDSTDPEVLTISKILGCSEKTVRNRRDRAFLKLRAALEQEKGNE